jgi:3-isopropylmalate/(R)-2-methylmalate dehydratase large subunit
MDDRFCMANMAIEAGAKNGIFAIDEKTVEYERRTGRKTKKYAADRARSMKRSIKSTCRSSVPWSPFPIPRATPSRWTTVRSFRSTRS